MHIDLADDGIVMTTFALSLGAGDKIARRNVSPGTKITGPRKRVDPLFAQLFKPLALRKYYLVIRF